MCCVCVYIYLYIYGVSVCVSNVHEERSELTDVYMVSDDVDGIEA